MCRSGGDNCGCERRIASAYRQRRDAGDSADAAFGAAVREFERWHPGSAVFNAWATVKDVLFTERDVGIVDC